MTVRNFDGAGDYIDFPVTSSLDIVGSSTLVVAFKATTDSVWRGICTWQTSADTYTYSLGMTPSNTVQLATKNTGGTTGAQASTTTVVAADGWVLLVVSHTAGTSGNVSIFKPGSGWTHTGTTIGVPQPTTAGVGTGKIRVGRYENTDDLPGRIAAIGVWGTTELTNGAGGQIEDLDNGTLASWTALGVTEVWEFDQAAWGTQVIGEKAVASSTAINGDGTIVADDPPSTIYTFFGDGPWPPLDNPAAPSLRLARSNLRIG